MSVLLEFRTGLYLDSVALMRVSRRVAQCPGVQAALVAMATPLNLEMAAGLGFDVPPAHPADDLMVALRAADDGALAAAQRVLAEELSGRAHQAAAGPGTRAPRTTGTAAAGSGARVALISVPGEHAFAEAMDALRAGLSVMVFSDNVPVGAEIRLKEEAAARGLLVMGPDCGTTILGGVGLGFANAVARGSVGIVAASGTGAQQLIGLLDAADIGISHCLGVGSRDLSREIGGRATAQALAVLDADPGTGLIVVLSKPPDAAVARQVKALGGRLRTPAVFAFLGPGEPDISATAQAVAGRLGHPVTAWPSLSRHPARATAPGLLRGLYSGGTLCAEAVLIATAVLGPVRANIPPWSSWRPGDEAGGDHLMIDFGDDVFTRGRPHPMIDLTGRAERLLSEAANPEVRAVLLDVVLGYGAHPDPAAELAPAIRAARGGAAVRPGGLDVAVALIGTRQDPQDAVRQAAVLADAGAHVFASNADAARTCAMLARGGIA